MDCSAHSHDGFLPVFSQSFLELLLQTGPKMCFLGDLESSESEANIEKYPLGAYKACI